MKWKLLESDKNKKIKQSICKVYTEIKEVLEERTLRGVRRAKERKIDRPRVPTNESMKTYGKAYQHKVSEN